MTGTEPSMRLLISTGDPDRAHDWLRSAYTDHSARLSGSRDAFRFSHHVADCGAFKVGVARHTMTLHGQWAPLDDLLLFSHLLSGRFTIRSPRAEVGAGPGDVFSYDPDSAMTVAWSDIRMAQIRVQRSVVHRLADEVVGADDLGRSRSSPIAFELSRPLTAAKAAHWRRLMHYVAGDAAANPAVHGSPLILDRVLRLVVVTALETFPHNLLDDRSRSPALVTPVGPGALRRAVAFIEEHAAERMDVTAVAEAAGVGPRALQHAFRRGLDTTPMAHLREVRLQRAHEELQAADPTDGRTVATIAARWGFGNPGRFAVDYRRRFGRRPSQALRDDERR